MTIRGAIFDLDGVITDTAMLHFKAWKKLADELGIAFDETDNERLKGVSRRASLDIILERAHEAYSDAEKEEMMARKNADYVALIETLTPEHVFPGVHAAFADLKARGMRIALASASKNAPAIITQLGMTDAFDYVADAARVANSKPAPDIFIDAAQGLGASSAECFGVEDAIAGIEAIHAAGMFAVGIGDSAILTHADLVFADMQSFDIARVLAKIS